MLHLVKSARTSAFFALFTTATLLCVVRPARADKAYANLNNTQAFENVAAAGTVSVTAYSRQALAGSNLNVTGNITTGGNTQNNPTTDLKGTLKWGDDTYKDSARLLTNANSPDFPKANLTQTGDQYTVTSTTFQYSGQASAFYGTAVTLTKVVTGRFMSATATFTPVRTNPRPPGTAVAQAVDPYSVSPGQAYDYSPNFNASIEVDDNLGTAGDLFFAVDSSTFTSDSVGNFVSDGLPLNQALWSLLLTAGAATSSPSQVGVDFELNPLALNELSFPSSFLTEIGPYSDPTSEALAIDAFIDNGISNALTVNPGNSSEIDLVNYAAFPDGTTFSAAGGGVTYEDAAEAEVAGVPEPASATILAVGGAGLLARRRR